MPGPAAVRGAVGGGGGARRRAQRVAARRQRLRPLRQRVPQLAAPAPAHQHLSPDLHHPHRAADLTEPHVSPYSSARARPKVLFSNKFRNSMSSQIKYVMIPVYYGVHIAERLPIYSTAHT